MRRLILCFTVLTLGLAACASSGSDPVTERKRRDPDLELAKGRTFGSEADLAAYLDTFVQDYEEYDEYESDDGDSSAGEDAAAPEATASDSITNNQEQGVDEGDIVKVVDGHLVVLRQGRLYAATIDGLPRQTDSMRVARTVGLNDGVWYDELLVDGDRMYVIGYRYDMPSAGDYSLSGATEINAFRLVDGRFERLATSFLESWDYFSGDNYASRMVDGQLVFYMPFSAISYGWYEDDRSGSELRIPRRFRYDDATNQLLDDGPLFDAADVYRPLSAPDSPTYHSVVRCTLPADGALDCASTTILGDYGREFYVSPTDVFVWVSDRVVAIGLLDGQVRAHAVSGYPQDQFAFSHADGVLYVATASDDDATLTMLRLPLDAFDERGEQPLEQRATELYDNDLSQYIGISAERWVGDTFVAAIRDGSYDYGYEAGDPVDEGMILAPEASETLVSYDAGTGASETTALTGWTSRIENAGTDRAVIVSETNAGVEMATYSVADAHVTKLASVSMGSASEGESRSHGFFYKGDESGGGGVFGLPILQEYVNGDAAYEDDWYGGSGLANVAFVEIATDGTMRTLGVVSSSGAEGVCETSCTDWYGNTRPIFYGDRTFALMGAELVEITVRPEVVRTGESLVFAGA